MKTRRITRIVKILTTLQSGKSFSIDELSKLFGKSRRTIFRDLEELDAIGVPYKFDSKSGGYKVDSDFFLPPIDLNIQEALSLLLLVHKAARGLQIPFKNSALLAGIKIENNLPVKMKGHCNIALETMSTKLHPQAHTNQLDEVFNELQKAVLNKQKLYMKYNSLYDGKVIEIELCPYHMMYHHRAWYVLGYSSLHKSIRMFKLNRIEKIKLTGKCFIDKEKIDVAEYLGRAWSMIPEGKIYNVKLKFMPKVATNVTEVNWHSTQKVTHNPDGSAIMEFRVDGINEIFWWILGYADQVQVLSPKILRERIVKAAANIIEMNKRL